MSTVLTINQQAQVAGKSYPYKKTVRADGLVRKEPSDPIPAAKTGVLTTRTSDSQGSATLAGGHGVTTGARLDVFWDGGRRLGMTVGTVAGNVVPLTDSGVGDNLPTANTPLTVCVPVEENLSAAGDDVQAILMFNDQYGAIMLCEDDDTPIYHETFGGPRGGEQSKVWFAGSGVTNPVAGDPIAKVYMSNSVATGVASPHVTVMFN